MVEDTNSEASVLLLVKAMLLTKGQSARTAKACRMSGGGNAGWYGQISRMTS